MRTVQDATMAAAVLLFAATTAVVDCIFLGGLGTAALTLTIPTITTGTAVALAGGAGALALGVYGICKQTVAICGCKNTFTKICIYSRSCRRSSIGLSPPRW